jgi:hypothetical protein
MHNVSKSIILLAFDRFIVYISIAITKDDYYEKSTEFRVWLREHKHRYFEDMKTRETHAYFIKFIKVWNRGKLEGKSLNVLL